MTRSEQPLFEFKQVTKNFGGLTAVNDTTFKIDPGEIVSIIGPNGAGKTTLINMATGVFPPTRGEILFRGQGITKLLSHRICPLGINRTFQHDFLFSNMSAIDNVLVGAHSWGKANLFEVMTHMGRHKREERERLEKARQKLSQVGLEEHAGRFPLNLSVKERKLLGIARALASEPELLFLDEPVGGLNFEEIQEISDLLISLNQQGTTIVFIEHRMELVMGISKRIIVLNFGQKIAEDIPAKIQDNKEVIAAYLGKD